MMKLERLILFIFIIIVGVQTPPCLAAEKSAPEKWREHMVALSGILVDGFPFFYSRSEFRDPKNRKSILSNLDRLANSLHELPADSGEAMIGAEPLIGNVKLNLKDNLNEAAALYKKGNFDSSQKSIHAAVQKCFACHTAHQIGPRFPATNQEVVGMSTPHIFGKAVVFGALRQFDGALDLIEKKGFSQINKDAVISDDLAKLYLVVSLRTEQDFKRALTFLSRLIKLSPDSEVLKKWKSDVGVWQGLSKQWSLAKAEDFIKTRVQADAGRAEDLFIVYLLESFALHKRILSKDATNEFKKDTFLRLSKAYEGLHFSALGDLTDIYLKAANETDSARK